MMVRKTQKSKLRGRHHGALLSVRIYSIFIIYIYIYVICVIYEEKKYDNKKYFFYFISLFNFVMQIKYF